VFDFMRPYMDGTTSSSLNEVRLGSTRFDGETHAYSVAWADHEVDEAAGLADRMIFNSIGQLDRFGASSSRVCSSIMSPSLAMLGRECCRDGADQAVSAAWRP